MSRVCASSKQASRLPHIFAAKLPACLRRPGVNGYVDIFPMRSRRLKREHNLSVQLQILAHLQPVVFCSVRRIWNVRCFLMTYFIDDSGSQSYSPSVCFNSERPALSFNSKVIFEESLGEIVCDQVFSGDRSAVPFQRIFPFCDREICAPARRSFTFKATDSRALSIEINYARLVCP